MRKIIVGFSSSTKKVAPFSKAIKWWDNCDYSHVYFQFESTKYDVDMIYQSSSTMLNYMSKEVFLLHNHIVHEFEIELTDEQYIVLMTNCMKSAGLAYGVLEIVGIFIADILNLTHNPFSDEEKYVCSEWVAEQLELLEYKFDKELELVKPIDVYMVLDYENTNERSKTA